MREQSEMINSGEGEAEYLEKDRVHGHILARFRLGSEVKCSKYSKDSEDRKCRLCKKDEETLRHVFEKCEFTKGEKKEEEILDRKEPGVQEMIRVIKIRKEAELSLIL